MAKILAGNIYPLLLVVLIIWHICKLFECVILCGLHRRRIQSGVKVREGQITSLIPIIRVAEENVTFCRIFPGYPMLTLTITFRVEYNFRHLQIWPWNYLEGHGQGHDRVAREKSYKFCPRLVLFKLSCSSSNNLHYYPPVDLQRQIWNSEGHIRT